MLFENYTAEIKLKRIRSHIMSHPSFAIASGILMIGEAKIVEAGHSVTTAATDGENTMYNRAFLDSLNEKQARGLVLHEEGHKMLCHLWAWRHLMKLDARLANMAADYVVNGWIVDTDPTGEFAVLPTDGALYNPDYSPLDVGTIFRLLKQEQDEGGGSGSGSGDGSLDSHDWEGAAELSKEEQEELGRAIEQAIREGQIMVGKLKGNVARSINTLMTPKIDWKEVLREFLSSLAAGKDTKSWHSFNRRYTSYDVYLPADISESMGEVVIAVDTSGSITDDVLGKIVKELVAMAKAVSPSKIRVLWWDTQVDKEQVIEGDYSKMEHILKASGGGGTRMGCVSEYIIAKGYKPECVLTFTDGYVEPDVKWQISCPSVFIVDGNPSFKAPAGGRVIKY
jgi:predicted metal-dependent peptidase